MFERDKEELRELGIPVETGENDAYFHDEVGYRIRRDEAELPDLELTREEAAVIGLATQVWEHAGLANDSTTALMKLKAIGVDVDTSVLRMAEPKLSTNEPSFDVMWDAVTRRIPVSFVYARPASEADGAPPAAVGDHLVARPLVRRRIRPRSRRAAHLPAVPHHRRASRRPDRPARTRCPRAPT